MDKVVHFCVYLPLGALLFRAFRFGTNPGSRWRTAGRALVAAVVVGLLYGISDELHQLFTPGRQADPFDVVADLLGASTGAALGYLVYRGKKE